MNERRTIRALPEFFEDVDRLFPAERDSAGRPSRSDFQTYDLLEIVDRFATAFDEMPQPIPGRPEYRELGLTLRLGVIYAVVAQLAPDGAVEIISLDVDYDGLPDPDVDG